MSKIINELRAKGIYNTSEIIKDAPEKYALTYNGDTGRAAQCTGWKLWSTVKKWDSPWYAHGGFPIHRHRCKDFLAAMTEAAKECGVTVWAPSPFYPRTDFVPLSALQYHGIKPTRVITVH